jgi:antitoxin component YwqK of YwqJK toxin-antitoxin module
MSNSAEAMIGCAWLKGRLRYLSNQDGSGEAVGYYESGAMRFRYPLWNGEMNGIGNTWYENGTLRCEESCCGGVLHGPARYWYPDGVMEKERHYRRGVFHGTQKEWHPNGTLKAQTIFVNNVLHGPVTEWHSNGRIRSQMNFVEGRKHGLHKFFNEDGSYRLKEIYVRGVRMPVRQYEKLLAGHFSARDILLVKNQAVRRIFLEEYGYARFLAQMPHKVVDRQGEQELVRITWHPREEPLVLVKVKCPSTNAFYTLRVPPSMENVRDAVAWTFGMKEEEYFPEKET